MQYNMLYTVVKLLQRVSGPLWKRYLCISVCTAAVRNSLEVRHRQVPPTPPTPTSSAHPLSAHARDSRGQNGTTDPIQALIEGSHPTQKVHRTVTPLV